MPSMSWPVFVILTISIALSTSSTVWAKGKTASCEKSLPDPLKAMLQRTYPEYQLANLAMLTDMGQKLYSQDSKSGCPGLAKIRFFDKDRVDYALVILTKADHARPYDSIYDLVVARKGENKSWDLTILEKDVQAAPPAVLTLPPGKYTGETEQQPHTLESATEVLFVVKYEAWSKVYASTQNGIEKVWLSD
jgi:hypothetical protein